MGALGQLHHLLFVVALRRQPGGVAQDERASHFLEGPVRFSGFVSRSEDEYLAGVFSHQIFLSRSTAAGA